MGRRRRAAPAAPADRENTPLMFLLLLLCVCFGGYYEWSVFLSGAVLCLLIGYTAWRDGHFVLPVGPESWPLYALALLNFLALPWAVSPGMALAGALRWLVALLFFVHAATYSRGERTAILDTMGYVGAAMAACSLVHFLWQTATGADNPNGRIDGFFQYANTYALFLTACLVLLLLKDKRRTVDYPAMAVLLCTVFLSGSRGVFLLAGGAAVFLGVRGARRGRGLRPLLVGAGVVLAVGLLAVILSDGLVLRRLGAITLSSSSLNGRLLYNLDGLRLLLDRPMGVGRGGYLYVQPLYQTGIYTLKSIHNEYLQAALDGGLLAGLALLALPVACLLRRGIPLRERLVILLFSLHACIDFDFHYAAVLFLLLLCASGGATRALRPPRGLLPGTLGVLTAALLYFTLPYGLSFLGQHRQAYALWPADLSLAEARLQHCATIEEAGTVAERILERTDLSMLAWDCLYTQAAQQADYPRMAQARYQYLRLNKYRGEVYGDFATLLETACDQPDAPAHMDLYKTLAERTIALIREVNSGTSPLAYRIADKPDLSFGTAILIRLQAIEER